MNSSNLKQNSKPLIIANTKAYVTSLKDFYKLQDKIWEKLDKDSYKYYVALPSPLISLVSREEYNALIVGAQNFETVELGAHTGSSTFENILEAGAKFIILGHSELRKSGETDSVINEKVKKSLSKKTMTVLCVGESQRVESFDYVEFIKDQIKTNLSHIDKNETHNLVVAYEPLWAIGAAISATSEQAQEAIIIIRRTLVDMFGIDNAKKIKVIYGGAVDDNNAKRFVSDATADGVLVGRACMDADKFSGIVNSLLD